jgi:hypothetical protein
LNPPSGPHSLARDLEAREFAAELAEEAAVRGDSTVRELARRKGRAVRAVIASVEQARSSRKPCFVNLRTDQPVLRIREGTHLQRVDGGVVGRVVRVTTEDSGQRLLRVELSKGVMKSTVPRVGEESDWVDAVPVDMSVQRNKIFSAMKAAQTPLVYGTLSSVPPIPPPQRDLLAVAAALRKR